MKNTANASRSSVRGLAEVALFAALIILLAFTPFIGYIPLGFTRATIIHIPVILGALFLGPKKGAVLGFIFGLTSLIVNTMTPTPTSFVFSPFYSVGEVSGGVGSVIICFVPRILIGVVPYFVYKGIRKIIKKQSSGQIVALAAAGLSGALTNTLLVMNLIFLFFRDSYAAANNVAAEAVYGFILTVIGMNGVPEAIVAAFIVTAAGKVLLKSKLTAGAGGIEA